MVLTSTKRTRVIFLLQSDEGNNDDYKANITTKATRLSTTKIQSSKN
jgi:hypothetical protein